MLTVVHGAHRIDIQVWGKEKVFYDGKQVTGKWSAFGATHVFQVNEEGEATTYEVEIGTRWHGFTAWVQVRRNGVMIFTNR